MSLKMIILLGVALTIVGIASVAAPRDSTPATGIVERVSVSSNATEGNRLSKIPSVSDDGRRVAFVSSSTNVASGDSNADFGESLVIVDSAGYVGSWASLALDSSGFPVISYYDSGNGDLKLVHCNDANCVGGNESIVTVDSAGIVGQYTSLALDSSGFPVISYFDSGNGDLKLAHCNDANCAGGNESIVTVDSAGDVGRSTSLVLDSSGFPVVSYSGNYDLKLAHCNDANCVGGNESIVTVDSAGIGQYTSLALDSSGFPVISYYHSGNDDLKLVHCNDANCVGGNESIVTVDSAGFVGAYASLALDSSGFPVVSYAEGGPPNTNLKLAHCNDANCVGGNESIVTVDSAFDVGWYASLALDSSGFPVISYFDGHNSAMKLAHCNDANCVGGNESIVTVDSAGFVGLHTSLALDSSGFPVVSYTDGGPPNTNLKLAHCNDANCAVTTWTFPDVPPDHWAWQFVEAISTAGLTSGYPDGTYRPNNPVTRAEMAVFIKKGIHGSTYTPPTPDGSHPFDDIAGHWAQAWIEDLYDEGFTSGFPDGTYRPDNQVTRAEMAVFLKKAIHGSAYTSPTPDGSHPFSDISGHWAEAWIEDLYDEAITSGFPDGTYRPENQVTRAEMAVFLVRAFSLPLP